MITISKCNHDDFATLAGIWERAVRATHDFLTEDDIIEIRNRIIPDYFPNVDIFGLSVDSQLTGFIGLSGNKIEMLFIDAEQRGNGYGSALIDFAKRQKATLVDVNEQNHYALKFYMNNGFHVISRDETDDSGRPFPILHLSL